MTFDYQALSLKSAAVIGNHFQRSFVKKKKSNMDLKMLPTYVGKPRQPSWSSIMEEIIVTMMDFGKQSKRSRTTHVFI